VDRVVDRGAGEAPDLKQVASLGLELGHLFDFLLTHVLEVDDDAVSTRFRHGAVEGHNDDAGVASLFDGALRASGEDALMTMAS